jgi:hypothetical protein
MDVEAVVGVEAEKGKQRGAGGTYDGENGREEEVPPEIGVEHEEEGRAGVRTMAGAYGRSASTEKLGSAGDKASTITHLGHWALACRGCECDRQAVLHRGQPTIETGK